MTWLGALVALVVALIGGIGGWITVRRNTTASPYEALAVRVVALEKADAEKGTELAPPHTAREDDRRTIRALVDDRDALVHYLAVLRNWIRDGATPPAPPVPTHLRDVLRWSWEPDHPTRPPRT